MDKRFVDLRSGKNGKARIKILKGHFATKNSHVNTYIDMSTVKTRHNNARETAKTLAEEYMTNTPVETIVCLKNTEVIGAFMAEYLSGSGNASVSAGKVYNARWVLERAIRDHGMQIDVEGVKKASLVSTPSYDIMNLYGAYHQRNGHH